MNFNLNDNIDKVLDRFYQTYSLTNGTADFVPESSMKLIDKQIDRAMRSAFKLVEKENKAFQKALKREERRQKRKEFWAKFRAFFKRKKANVEVDALSCESISATAETQEVSDVSSPTFTTPKA